MNKLLILLVFLVALPYTPTSAIAKDGDFGNRMKHGSVAFAISGGLTYLCRRNIRLTDGTTPQWGCFLMGVIPTFLGATFFEGAQNDLTDAGGDLAAAAVGATAGSLLTGYVFPKSWYDRKGVDFTIQGTPKAQLAVYW